MPTEPVAPRMLAGVAKMPDRQLGHHGSGAPVPTIPASTDCVIAATLSIVRDASGQDDAPATPPASTGALGDDDDDSEEVHHDAH